MNIQRKPYEISLWTTTSNSEGNLVEKKLGVIGSAEMEDSPFRAFDPHFIENINGSKTLTFSIFWRWYNPETQEFESNPWEKYLVNERRVKLKYDGNWYEFVIKEMEESKEEYKKTFTCTSAPILELSRNGYNVELDDTLYNNQGTVIELAQRILDDSDWIVDEENSEKIYSFYTEHIYTVTTSLTNSVTLTKVEDPTTTRTLTNNTNIILFYSEVEKEISPTQVIIGIPANLQKDSNNVLINQTVYLYDGPYTDLIGSNTPTLNLTYKATRYTLSQLGHYDPILKAYVKDYDINGDRKYGYIHTDYLTSDVVGSLVNNGDNYVLTTTKESLESWGTYIQNWYAGTGATLNQTTYPGLTDFGDITTGSQINLSTDPESVMTGLMLWDLPKTSNYIYNTSIKENLNFLPNGIIKGNKYVFRAKYALIKKDNLKNSGYMSVPSVAPGVWNDSPGWPTPKNSTLKCKLYLNNKALTGMECNTINGASTGDYVHDAGYVQAFERVEGVSGVTVPANEGWYTYSNGTFTKVTDTSIIYDSEDIYYKSTLDRTGIPYYYGIMTAGKSYSKEELNNASLQFRFYCNQNLNNYKILVQSIEFFQYIPDEKCEYPILDRSENNQGEEITCFYSPGSPLISETQQTLKIFDQSVNFNNLYETQYEWEAEFTDLENTGDYVPVYNDYLAINTVEGAQSNYYNLIQEVCETFQCWADFRIDHYDDGRIKEQSYYYLSPDIKADPAATYYLKEGNTYTVVDSTSVPDYDPVDPDKYYNPRVLGWYEKKTTGKTVVFKKFVGKANYAGFRYGVNLSSITRSLDSNAFVSKMIVANNDVEGIQTGTCSIERAEDNPTGTTSVYDFTYYVNQQLLDKDTINNDLYLTTGNWLGFYPRMKELSTQHLALLDNWNLVSNEMITQGARKQTYQAESEAARDNQSESLEDLCNFIRNDSKFMVETYAEVYPSDSDVDQKVRSFVKKYWDEDPEHNSTIYYWVKYVTATQTLSKSLKELEVATDAYNKAETRYKEITKELREIEGEISVLTKAFLNKYSDFIQEGTWNDQDAIDDDIYYYDAVNVLRTSAQPQVSYGINVIELSELEGYEPYTFAIGDKTYIEDTEFFGWTTNGSPYREEVTVSEIDWALDDPSTNTITVQNYRTQFEDLFQRLSASVQQAELNANAYNRAIEIVQPSGKIDQSALQKTFTQNQNQLSMGFGTGSITQNNEGIIIEGFGTDKKNKLKITGKGIFITQDNGDTWTPVMRGTGTNASVLTDGSLDVSNINIIDSGSPTFQWNGDGLTAYGFTDITYTETDYVQGADLWEEGQIEEIEIGTQTYTPSS